MAAAENSALALQDCSMPGDRYGLQVRYVGEPDWRAASIFSEVVPAERASLLVRELNASSAGRGGDVVYRSVLVEVVRG